MTKQVLCRPKEAVLLALIGLLMFARAPLGGPVQQQLALPEKALLSSLALDLQAARGQWAVTGEPVVVPDEVLGTDVYEVAKGKHLELSSSASFSGAYAVQALVRFPSFSAGREGNATLDCGVPERGGKPEAACSLRVACRGGFGYEANATLSRDLVGSMDSGPPQPKRRRVRVSERYHADKPSERWNKAFRASVEKDMAKLPPGNEVWRRLRIEVRPGGARLYHNGFLVAEHGGSKPIEGHVRLVLNGEARLASLEVLELGARPGPYVTVPLDSACNAVGPVAVSSLPPAGQEVVVQEVPFVFPHRTGRADHVDVGQSVFRYGMTGSAPSPRDSWPAPTLLDPARIMLRVPNRAYRRAWILAASDAEPNSIPVLTVRFFRALKGWPLDSTLTVPEFTARTGQADAKRIEVRMKDGTKGNLWLLPIEIAPFWLASDFREEEVLNIELTKQVREFSGYYGSFQAGLPSAVHLYGLTLEKSPVSVIASGNRSGNLYMDPEQPTWIVSLTSQSDKDQRAEVALQVTDPYGAKSRYEGTATVPAAGIGKLTFRPHARRYGLHKVKTTVMCSGLVQSREGTFLLVPPNARKEDAKTSRWGLWCWAGGHSTNPDPQENLRLLWTLGARVGARQSYEDRKKWGIGPQVQLLERSTPAFAQKDPYDPAEYAAFSEEFGKKVADRLDKIPDLQYVTMFGEHAISRRITHGPPPYLFGEPWYEYTDEQKQNIRAHLVAAQAAFEGTRKYGPGVKFLFGWCGPLFPVPFLREQFPKELFDGFGIDSAQFELMPEYPPRGITPNHMYFLWQELKRWGYEDKELVHTESYFPPSHPMALGHRTQADHVVRTAVLSLAHGTDRFTFCWELHDSEDYWGTSHYGCAGMIGRRPEYNPKPAAAAFSTMTQMLDKTSYDGWVPTGSRSAYCVRFKAADRLVYCLWTIRGSRPVELTASLGGSLVMVDENSNRTALRLAAGRATVTITPTPIWVEARGGKIEAAQVGAPTHTEAPAASHVVLDDFEKADWAYDPAPYERYATVWDMVRLNGKMESSRAMSSERGSRVWSISLKEDSPEKPFVGWYGVFTPPEPLLIPGKARALGIWVKGNSGWGRVVYELEDAKGEHYISCSTPEAWFDDGYSWSYFNFDGWRYVEFPLPGNSPGDNCPERNNGWWGRSAEGVVDLPVKVRKIIFEMPTHQLYVDEVLPVGNLTVEVDDLTAVYDSAEMMTEAPVKLQQVAARAAGPARSEDAALQNPHRELLEKGVGAPTEIVKFYPPELEYDGTRIHVSIKPVQGAKRYQVWVSTEADGRGARVLADRAETDPLVQGLKPDLPLYFFVTYTDAQGKTSKPSALRKTVLKDEFPMK